MVVAIVAYITPNADKVDDVRQGLIDFAEVVKAKEPGALRYKITEQANAESTPIFVVIEEYKDQAAVDTHMGSDDFKALGQGFQENNLLAKPLDITTLKIVGGYDSK